MNYFDERPDRVSYQINALYHLRAEVVKAAERAKQRSDTKNTLLSALPYVLAILALPLAYHLLFRRR